MASKLAVCLASPPLFQVMELKKVPRLFCVEYFNFIIWEAVWLVVWKLNVNLKLTRRFLCLCDALMWMELITHHFILWSKCFRLQRSNMAANVEAARSIRASQTNEWHQDGCSVNLIYVCCPQNKATCFSLKSHFPMVTLMRSSLRPYLSITSPFLHCCCFYTWKSKLSECKCDYPRVKYRRGLWLNRFFCTILSMVDIKTLN